MVEWLRSLGPVQLFLVVILVCCSVAAAIVLLFPGRKENGEDVDFDELASFFKEVKPTMNHYNIPEEEEFKRDEDEKWRTEGGLIAKEKAASDGEDRELFKS
ncbi:hypothetical protein [Paenibacillus sp. J2TS4]|uniref:hypothetical protein n=1 Tax=Paenibacillus sp. J2TS4 TaxID=2807194 RepID=UPI001B1DCB65|nr:hypothetical protein [Paenibacillus sp. J2TS4]GIP34632.1 hypothetical protein J2TS4_38420 [Paenibacillus sp. J2TS4]